MARRFALMNWHYCHHPALVGNEAALARWRAEYRPAAAECLRSGCDGVLQRWPAGYGSMGPEVSPSPRLAATADHGRTDIAVFIARSQVRSVMKYESWCIRRTFTGARGA